MSQQPQTDGDKPPVTNDYDEYLRQQIELLEDAIDDGRCYPEMPEGQFVRSK